MIKLSFSDYFNIDPKLLDEYGAFNISLVNDLPLFVDPFLLFNSKKPEYQALHSSIIQYVAFLRDMSQAGGVNKGILKAWYSFPEIKQNWLGFSKTGNKGSGLGDKFASSLNSNLNTIFNNFGREKISNSSHLEKLCLIKDGVGRDNISDFTVNLVKDYLLTFTEVFAKNNIDKKYLKKYHVSHAYFNYETKSWASKHYLLPSFKNDYVILTPKDILTKDETWINKEDLHHRSTDIISSIPNEAIRAKLNQYLVSSLPEKPNKKDWNEVILKLCDEHPEYIDYYVKYKEDNGEEAVLSSHAKVAETKHFFNENTNLLTNLLEKHTAFYDAELNSLSAARERGATVKCCVRDVIH